MLLSTLYLVIRIVYCITCDLGTVAAVTSGSSSQWLWEANMLRKVFKLRDPKLWGIPLLIWSTLVSSHFLWPKHTQCVWLGTSQAESRASATLLLWMLSLLDPFLKLSNRCVGQGYCALTVWITIQTGNSLWWPGSVKWIHLSVTWRPKGAPGDVAKPSKLWAGARTEVSGFLWGMPVSFHRPDSSIIGARSRDFSLITNSVWVGCISRLFAPGCVDAMGQPNPFHMHLSTRWRGFFFCHKEPWSVELGFSFLLCSERIVLSIFTLVWL